MDKKSDRKKSDVSVMLKEAAILFVITLISGLVLGFVYELTKKPIQDQKKKAVQEACMAVFPGEGNAQIRFEEIAFTPDASLQGMLAENKVKIGTVYAAYAADGSLAGYVVESSSARGYGGAIVLYTGIAADGRVNGVSILEIQESPGLGMEAPTVLTPQFAGKYVDSFTYTKTGSQSESEIDAISGATITTRAVTDAVNGALKTAQTLLQGGGANE